ncbi:MAG: DUF481 domain-containing protein [Gemmatimonadota bacterium]
MRHLLRAAGVCWPFASAIGLAGPAVLAAQENGEERGWFQRAELTLVLTGGNAQARTLGFGAGTRRVGERIRFKLEAGGVRSESSIKTRTAIGTATDFEVADRTSTETTAESYYLRSRYDQEIGRLFFWYVGGAWDRNTFAGFDSRVSAVLGAGNRWRDGERMRFRTGYGLTATYQKDVIANPETRNTFAGARLSADFFRKLTESTDLTSVLRLDENLDNTRDLRADWTNALVVSMSGALALKTSLQLLWDNDPSLADVPLVTAAGMPTGQTVRVPLDRLDTFLTIAVVAKF